MCSNAAARPSMRIEAPWGDVFTFEQIAAALEQHPKTKLVGIVHAETSTGAHQPLEGLADLVHQATAPCCSSTPSRVSAGMNCAWMNGASMQSTAARRNA